MSAAAGPALVAGVLALAALAMPARARTVWPVWQRLYGRNG